MQDQSGIYCLYSNVSDKIYIGSSKFVNKRNRQHFKTLEKGNHKNPHLQSFYDKHGKDSLFFKVLEYCDESELLYKEQRYIDSVPKELRFNVADFVDRPPGTLGRIFTEEHRQNISNALTGGKMPDSHKEKSRERMLVNNPMSNPESRKAISDAQLGVSIEECKKIWELNQSGKYYPIELEKLLGIKTTKINTILRYAAKYLFPEEEIYKVGKGSKRISNKLSFDKYFEIYSKNLSGVGRSKLALEYNCSEKQITNIIKYCKDNPEAGEITYLPPISKKRGYTWNKGLKISEETRQKISIGSTGRKMPQSQREATSKRIREQRYSSRPNVRRKISDSRKSFTDNDCTDIYQKHSEGKSFYMIAKEYGWNKEVVKHAFNYYNKYLK